MQKYILSIIAISVFFYSCKKKEEKKEAPIAQVQVVQVEQKDVLIYKEFVGQTLGLSDIQIKSRIDGWVTSIDFKEGRPVTKGQLLYTVDDMQYRNRVDQAASQLAKIESQLTKADQDLKRIKPLADMNALSKRDLDQAQSAYNAALAEKRASEAALANAKIELGYAQITSPITGLAGISKVREGDYVGKSAIATAMTTISDISQVRVRFPVTEVEFLEFKKANRKVSGTQEFSLILADGSTYNHKGKINFADREVDPETGSLIFEAIFPNKEGLLRPGQYVKVRANTEVVKGAILVPQKSVIDMQGNKLVYVLDGQNKIAVRPVKLGGTYKDAYIITEGLKTGDKVALIGTQSVNATSTIEATTIKWSADSLK